MTDRRTENTPLVPRRTLGTEAVGAPSRVGGPAGPAHSTAGPLPGESAPKRGVSSVLPGLADRPQKAPAARSRRARLRVTHLDPWSVMKVSFLLSVAFGVVSVVAVSVVMAVLGASGVWESINQTAADVLGNEAGSTFDITDYVGTSRVLGFTMIVAVVDVVLITVIATLGAFLYNLAAALLGGLEVILAEEDH